MNHNLSDKCLPLPSLTPSRDLLLPPPSLLHEQAGEGEMKQDGG